MSALSYLNARKGEFLLVLVSAWAVSSVVLNGFFLDNLTTNYGYGFRLGLVFVLDVVLCFALYMAGGTKGYHAIGIVAYLVLAAVYIVVALALSTGENGYVDAEGNYLYLALVLILTCAACFVLTRSLIGSMAWFVAAAFACSLIQAFYQSGELVLSVIAAVSSLSLVVYRNFSLGVQGSQLGKDKKKRFVLPSAIVPVLCAAGLALVAWFAVIVPLNPGVIDVKLITEYRRLPIEEYIGTAQEWPQMNYDMTSDQTTEGDVYTTDDLQVDNSATKEVDANSIREQLEALGVVGAGSGSAGGAGTQTQPDPDERTQKFDAFSYDYDITWAFVWLLLALLIIALIVGFFVLRRRRRMGRLMDWLDQPPRDQVVLLYRFIYERLRRLGFVQPEGMTLREFAISSARSMDTLTEETGASFRTLTETYVACVYGDYEPTEDDVVPFVSYYLRFWKAARAYLGNFRYFFKSFRL